ncbi:MAG: hypothetical protein ABI162_17305 [Luteolibacter sp.]
MKFWNFGCLLAVLTLVFHPEMGEAATSVAGFCKANVGKKVGDGQCWALANEAFKASGKSRPTKEMRVWGRLVNFFKEPVQAGDVLEFQSVRFSEGIITGSHHTAVVIRGGNAGKFTVAEQNFGGNKWVSFREMSLKTRVSGKVAVYRPE